MATINPGWYAGNATRAYPLDDAATARDDAGRELSPQILVDCRLKFPAALGRFAYVGGITVGPGIVTAVLLATSNAARPPAGAPSDTVPDQPLGAVSLPTPVVPYRHYPIKPMAAGVGGWLVFGPGISEPYSGRFSTPGQSILLPRVAAAYGPPPIPTLGKLNVDPPLTGVIQLLGATDLEVVQDTREIEGGIVDTIIIRLVDSLNRNVFGLYTGPCGGRPESGTCAQQVVESINGVVPDCDGNLTINFSGAQTYPFAAGGGLALDVPLGMADVCTGQDVLPDSEGNLPGDYEGACPPMPPPVIAGGLPPVPPTGGLPPAASGCTPMPFYDSFDEATISNAWVVTSGVFAVEADDSPGEPYGLEQPAPPDPGGGGTPTPTPTPTQPAGFPGLMPLSRASQVTAPPDGGQGPPDPGEPGPPTVMVPVDQSYCAISQSQRNVSIWNCDYDSSNPSGMTVTTQFKMMAGPQINAGIILAYVVGATSTRPDGRPMYAAIVVNPISGFIELGGYNGSSYSMAGGIPFGPGGVPVVGDWYQLVAQYIPKDRVIGTQVYCKYNFILTGITNPSFPMLKSAFTSYAPTMPKGKCGLTTNNAHTRFSWYRQEILPPL